MIAHVALPLPIDSLFSYRLPPKVEDVACPRLRVKVPFRNRLATGVIVETTAGEGEGLKEVLDLVDVLPYIDEDLFRLSLWAARYYITPLGVVFKYAFPPPMDPEKHLTVRGLGRAHPCEGLPLRKAIHEHGLSLLMGDYRAGAIALHNGFTGAPYRCRERTEGEGYSAHLTVASPDERSRRYLRLISETMSVGKKVLMLVPDRHTVGDYIYRFLSNSLPGRVFWFGSSGTGSARIETYFRAQGDDPCVVLGTRSSTFLPVARLGLILVERPEEDEYRNEKDFKFNAVTVAMKRAEMEALPVVLGSAAPPLEIMRRVEEKVITMEESRDQRPEELDLIRVTRPRYVGYRLPEELLRVAGEALGRRERIAIYVPRRDYAAHLYCLECRSPYVCPACSGSVSYHKAEETISCHRCRSSFPYVEKCGTCGGTLLQFSSVGAEYVREKMGEAFPGVPLVTVTGVTVRRREGRVLEKIATLGKAGIVIGTNILGKLQGFNAQNLILIGVEDLLRVAGYRAREKTFQVVRNLSHALEPLRTTFCGSEIDPAIVGEPGEFYAHELSERRRAGFPPYTRLFLITVPPQSGSEGIGRISSLIHEAGMEEEMLGPVKEPWTGRWSIVLKGAGEECLDLLGVIYRKRGVRIEPDPLSI